MLSINNGQCGLCTHFGETHSSDSKLIQIRTSKSAPETYTDDCGHPRHAALNLRVTANSGCTGFEPAK